MRRPVSWSRAALDDLREQAEVIALDNPFAARRVVDRIRGAAKALGEFATGRPGRVTGIYEKSLGRPPYIIAYALRSVAGRETVVILRVIHAARDWSAGEWPE